MLLSIRMILTGAWICSFMKQITERSEMMGRIRLPKEAKIADGTTKDIFRKAVSKYIPQDTDGRKKLGFPIPIRVWLLQDDWYQMVKELFTSKEAEEFFHTEKLLQLLREHKEGKKDNSRKIWIVYMFLVWHHVYFS